MPSHTVLLSSFLLANVLVSACAGGADRSSTPTAPSSPRGAESSQGATRPPQPPRTDPPPTSGTCVASQARWAIGRAASDELLERARVDAGASVARFVRPNQPITMEYSSARLNLTLNVQDVVQAVICG